MTLDERVRISRVRLACRHSYENIRNDVRPSLRGFILRIAIYSEMYAW